MTGIREVGHGAHGGRSALRNFSEFARQGASTKRAYCEVQAGKRAHTFYPAGATSYSSVFQQVFDGVLLDVTGVNWEGGSLVRVDSAARCDETAGSFFYDANVPRTQPKWDIDFDFDLGDRWDSAPSLYVHLPGELDPNLYTIVALFTFIFGVAGEIVPTLGPNLSVDPGLETWNTPTDLQFYLEMGSVNVTRESTIKRGGLYSVKIVPTGVMGVGAAGGVQGGGPDPVFGVRSIPVVAGATYLIDLDYLTQNVAPGMTALLRAAIWPGSGATQYVLPSGREYLTVATGTGLELTATGGQWRRATWFIVSPADSTGTGGLNFEALLLNKTALNLSAVVYFDNIRVRRVYGYTYVEPRLSPSGLPTLTANAKGVTFGSQTMGSGNITLLNGGDDYFERLLATFDVCSRNVVVRYGGVFDDGQEITYDATRVGWTAVLEDFEGDSDAVTLRVPSLRSILGANVPPGKYDRLAWPGVAEADLGRPRPIVLGTVTGVRPARVLITSVAAPAEGAGVYEVVDPTYRLQSSLAVYANPSAVYAYESAEAAEAKDPARRVLLVAGRDYHIAGDGYRINGLMAMIHNPGPVRVVAGQNDAIDFANGGPPLVAYITPGLYAWGDLIAAVGSSMTTAAGVAHTCIYDTTLHRITLQSGAGAFSLLIASGANKARSILPTLGLGQKIDLTASLFYNGDTLLEHNPDNDHIRLDHTGYIDDTLGTYSGTPSGLIERPPDCARFLLQKVAGIPVELIDVDSFVAARATSPQSCGVYLGGSITMTLGAALDALEFSGYGDIVSDSEGRFRWVPRVDDVPGYAASVATKVYDHELIDLSWSRSLEDTLYKIRVRYAPDPVTGKFRIYEQTNTEVPVRYGRTDSRDFDTWLRLDGDASTLAVKLSRICTRPMNHYILTVKGALLDVLLSDILDVSELSRKLLDYEDSHEPFMLRVKGYRIDFLTHLVQVVGYSYYFGLPPL